MQSQWRARGLKLIDLTDVQLGSSETARRINRDIVLELIRAKQPISRADLSRHSGLQRSTVSQIVAQLIREKWVCAGAVASPPRGRHPHFGARDFAGVAGGAEVGGDLHIGLLL